MNISSPITAIKGVGEKTKESFEKLGVYTVGDILLYFPRDYERFPKLCDIDNLQAEQKNALSGAPETEWARADGKNSESVISMVTPSSRSSVFSPLVMAL